MPFQPLRSDLFPQAEVGGTQPVGALQGGGNFVPIGQYASELGMTDNNVSRDDFGDLSPWENALNDIGLNLGVGVGSGVEIAGALADIVYQDAGETLRQQGIRMQDYLKEKMSPEMQAALDRSWLDVSSEGAWRDPRSYLAAVAQSVPYLIGTGGLGEIGAVGLRAAGVGAKAATRQVTEAAGQQAAKMAARKVAYPIAGGVAGAGEAAQGAGQAADAANLSPEQRTTAMRTAAPIGAVAGAALGTAVEHVLSPTAELGGAVGRVAAGIAGETAEEGGTQLGTEIGKYRVGLGFDPRAIAEAAVGGAVVGGLTSGAVAGPATAYHARVERKQKAERAARTAEEQAAANAEAARQRALLAEEEAKASDAVEYEYSRYAAQPKLLPAPSAYGKTSAIGTAGEQFHHQQADTALAQKPPATITPDPNRPVELQPAAQQQFVGDAAKATLDTIDGRIKELSTALADARTKLEGEQSAVKRPNAFKGEPTGVQLGEETTRLTPKARVKLAAQFRADTKELETLTRQRDDFLRRMREAQPFLPAADAGRDQLAIPGMDELASQTDPTIFAQTAEDGHLDDALDRALGKDDATPPLLALHDASVARSQRARAAAQTRWQKRRAEQAQQTGLSAPIQDATPPQGTTSIPSRGHAEAQAIRSRLPTAAPGVNAPTVSAQAALQPPTPGPPATPAPGQPVTGPSAGPPGESQQPQIGGQPPAPIASPEPGAAVQQPATKPAKPQRGYKAAAVTEVPRATLTDNQSSVNPSPIPPEPRVPKLLAELTPAERLNTVLADGPKSTNVVLGALKDAFAQSGNKSMLDLTTRLQKLFPDSKKAPNKTRVMNRSLANGFQGLYDPNNDTVYVDLTQAEDSVSAVLHEIVHAATRTSLANPRVRQTMERMMGDAADWFDRLGYRGDLAAQRGFNSVEEFVSYALTDQNFQDMLAGLVPAYPNAKGEVSDTVPSFWTRFKGYLRDRFLPGAPQSTRNAYEIVMEMVLDGALLQEGNRQEAIDQLNALGVQDAQALFTTLRSSLRTNSLPAILSGGSNRVWQRTLRFMQVSQIAQSYGKIGNFVGGHDTVNRLNEYISGRGGAARARRALASRIINVYKDAVQSGGGSAFLDEFMVQSRYTGIHADLAPAGVPLPNTPGYTNNHATSKPGGMEAYNFMVALWKSPQMTDKMKLAYHLIRDYSVADREDKIGRMMIARLRGLVDNTAADRLEAAIDNPNRTVTMTHGGIAISWQKVPNIQEIRTFVNRLGLSQTRADEISTALSQVRTLLGLEPGPYIPLRRQGDYYMHILSPNIQATMSERAFGQLLSSNRLGQRAPADIEVVSQKQLPNGDWRVEYRHTQVQAFDTELEARLAHEEARKSFAARGITIRSSKFALGADHAFQAVGMQHQSLMALQDDLRKAIPGAQGELAAQQVMRTYLEKIPDTSVRKAQLRARKVSGASRDMLHVLSATMQGNAYFSAQARFGHKISRTLTTDMKDDIDELHRQGKSEQAIDLTKLQNHFMMRDRVYDRLAEAEEKGVTNIANISKWWQRAPQIAGAWLLTGPGTAITNAMQPATVGYPWLAARFGNIATTGAMAGAFKDIIRPLGWETIKEGARFAFRTPRAILDTARGLPLPNIRDPVKSVVDRIADNLPAQDEKDMLRDLANMGKIDFGMVADLQSLSERAGRAWTAIQYITDGAFILPQAIETSNRSLMAVATYRLYKRANPNMSYGDLVKRAADAIDQTQFNYAYENRPMAFQNDHLRAALTFKTYPQAMWYTIVHNMTQMMHADTPAEKWTAVKFTAGMLGLTMASSGLMGILAFDPFYAAALAIVTGFTDDDDPEQALRRAMREVNADLVNTILKGVPYGMGWADTGRMGLPQFFPIDDIAKTLSDPQAGWTEYLGTVGEWFVGAPGSIMGNMKDAAVAAANGNMEQAAVMMTPKAFGINDLTRAWVYVNRGAADSRGYTFIDPGEISSTEGWVRRLGFEPPQIAERKAQRRVGMSRFAKLREERTDLMTRFARTHMAGDYDGRDAVLKKIAAYNDKNPGMRITRAGLKSSIRTRRQGQESVDVYGVNASTRGQKLIMQDVMQNY